MSTPRIDIPRDALAELCRKWRITELSLFGSVLRDDFGPESDVDILVTFEPGAPWSYWDWPVMQDDLSTLLGGRAIDLVEARAIVNPIRRRRIFSTRKVLYAA